MTNDGIRDADALERNKALVRRFNERVIGHGDESAFRELVAPHFVNRTAPPGAPSGPEAMLEMLTRVLRGGLSELSVVIHDQLAEGDKVTTRKSIQGVHTGELLGVPATGETVRIDVIDIVRVEDGRYVSSRTAVARPSAGPNSGQLHHSAPSTLQRY